MLLGTGRGLGANGKTPSEVDEEALISPPTINKCTYVTISKVLTVSWQKHGGRPFTHFPIKLARPAWHPLRWAWHPRCKLPEEKASPEDIKYQSLAGSGVFPRYRAPLVIDSAEGRHTGPSPVDRLCGSPWSVGCTMEMGHCLIELVFAPVPFFRSVITNQNLDRPR